MPFLTLSGPGILQRIRSVTGASDPDKGETPEQQQAKQQKAMMAKAMGSAEQAARAAVGRPMAGP